METVDNIKPRLGEIKRADELGYKQPNSCKYIWSACGVCGKERWVALLRGKPRGLRCIHCMSSGDKHYRWSGGIRKGSKGYILTWISPDDFFYPMVTWHSKIGGYLLKHRLVMAQHLGRCLESREVVHHKNGRKNDNRFENLTLTTRGLHSLEHSRGYRDGYQKGLDDGRLTQVEELKSLIVEQSKLIKLLQWQVKERVDVRY